MSGITRSSNSKTRKAATSGLDQAVKTLGQLFGMLVAHPAIGAGKFKINKAKRLLRDTLAIQQVLLAMKLNLEDRAN